MNIFGEGFPKKIIEQIKTRQTVYGYGFSDDNFKRNDDFYIYANANTSWCKLISSTTISNIALLNNELIKNLGYKEGDNLARNFILFNGTTTNNSLEGKSGLNYSQDPLKANQYAYNSWGIPSADFGFRPMAGIQSVSVKHKNLGSIRTAVVNIKAWDKATFEIIDILYLRLGFSVLLEWGNSMYYESNLNLLETKEDNSLANEFLEAKMNYKEFLDEIQNRRISSYGNYDAMFAKVTNFHWSFNKDGSYDITLNLISIGDIIESFKIKGNSLNIGITNQNITNDPSETNQSLNINTILKEYAPTSDIANYLYKSSLILNDPSNLKNLNYILNYNSSIDNADNYWKSGGGFETAFNSPGKTKDIVKVTSEVIKGGTLYSNPTYYFIRLGNLLKFIQNDIIYRIKNKTGKESPILNFDYSFDNFMHSPPQMMSYDPSVCMVRKKVLFPGITEDAPPLIPEREYFATSGDTVNLDPSSNQTYGGNSITNGISDEFMVSELDEVGKIMNIYINFKYILDKLQELTDKDTNEVKLLDFLKEITSGINSAFGGYSKLDLFIDETTNTLKIIDQNPLPSNKKALEYRNKFFKDKIPTDYALFELYGYVKREKEPDYKTSFIQDFRFSTEITPDLSQMITVAATNNGNVVGENNTALSKLNLGLVDKYKTEINGGGKKLDNITENYLKELETLQNNFKTASDEYASFIQDGNFQKYIIHLSQGVFLPEEITEYNASFTIYFKLYKKFQKTYYDLINYDQEKSCSKPLKDLAKFQPGTGFIPFNLSLTMDGLSGVKIGSKFLIDAQYLPTNYPDTVDFLIKNISHEIKNNKWTTTFESYCISQGDNNYKTPKRIITQTNPSPPAQPSSGNQQAQKSNKTLKQIIIDAGYPDGTPEHVFALSIGTKEGWSSIANGRKGSRSYRNNNPGNIDYSNGLRTIDPNVALENNIFYNPNDKKTYNRFAQFTTAELGVKALVEYKIKRWAAGNMPITSGNQSLIEKSKGGPKYKSGSQPTLAQFVYTYAPPNENNTEGYLASLLKDLKTIKSDSSRTTLVIKFL